MKMRHRRKRSAIIARHGAVLREFDRAHERVGIEVANVFESLATVWRDVVRKFVADMEEASKVLTHASGSETRLGRGM